MFANKPEFKSWVSISAVLGFLMLLLYLYFFGNLGQIASTIEKTSAPIYILAFICVLGGAVFNSLTWQGILGKLSIQTTFRRVFTLSWVGTFVDALIPGGWSGDIFKAYLLSKDGIDGAKTAASIVIKNVLELLVTLGALVTGMVLLAINYSLDSNVILAVGITMVLLSLPLIIIIYFSANVANMRRVLGWANRLFARIRGRPVDTSPSAEGKLMHSLGEFHDGLMLMKTNPKAMVRPMIYQSLAWTFDILTLFLIFASIGYIVSPDKIIITNTIVVNLQSQGFALAGFTQMVSSAIYTVLGISPLISMTSSLLAAFPTFWFKTAIAFVAFQVIVFDRAIPFFYTKCETLNVPNAAAETEFVGLAEES
jgi:uncharacterized protein (TIRG00374 family)